MFDPVYLSPDDRKQLAALNESLRASSHSYSEDELQVIRDKIQDIENKKVPLSQCNFEQCLALNRELSEKASKAVSIGKDGIAANIMKMIRRIDERMNELQYQSIKSKLEEQDKAKAKGDLREFIETTVNSLRRKQKHEDSTDSSKGSRVFNPWSIKID